MPPGVPSAPGLISIVTPAYNEETVLSGVIRRIVAAVAQWPHEVIIVDDGSRDGTWAVIESLKRELPQVRGLRFTRNFGHQAAIVAGLAAAGGEAVVMLDSDGQHPPEPIPDFVRLWREGHVVVQGIRTQTEDEGAMKALTSRLFYRTLVGLGGPRVERGSADFRLLGRPAVDVVLDSVGPLLFLRGLVPWLGFPQASVPFDAPARGGGRTKYTWLRMIQFSIEGVMSFSIVPLRLAIALGLTVAASSFLYLLFVVVAWFTNTRVTPGWASVAGLMSLFGGIQLVMIGVLGEYLGRLFLSQLNRPHYVIRDEV